MGNPLAGIGMDFNRSQFMARQRIESQINLPRLFAAIPVKDAFRRRHLIWVFPAAQR
ncbi:hypothetical protein C4J97_0548 [Pseudomonas orientalis]|nr:hypothetical protein C4J97_0548 [Pseudomonas orientalis]